MYREVPSQNVNQQPTQQAVENNTTRPVSDLDVSRVMGDVEPLDLDQDRNQIKETTWHC